MMLPLDPVSTERVDKHRAASILGVAAVTAKQMAQRGALPGAAKIGTRRLMHACQESAERNLLEQWRPVGARPG